MKRKHEEIKEKPKKKAKKTDPSDTLKEIMETQIKGFQYKPSKYDQPEKVRIGNVNVLGKIRAMGVFATSNFEPGEIVCEYTGEFVKDYNPEYTISFTHNRKTLNKDATYFGNQGRAINGASGGLNNCVFILGPNQCSLVKTTKPVRPGEQFLVDYGESYRLENQIYLNADDTDQSSSAYYALHKNEYYYLEKEQLLVPKVCLHLIKNEPTNYKSYTEENIRLYILKYNTFTKNPYEYSECDKVSILMLACQKGNITAVDRLIALHANINQLQNSSGNSALHFAMKGYKTAPSKECHVSVIVKLIKHGASIKIQNKKNVTFMHEAIRHLSLRNFQKIFEAIPNHLKKSVLTAYVGKDGDDCMMYSLRYKRLDNFEFLFTKYDYKILSGPNKGGKMQPHELVQLVKHYDQDEFKNLCNILKNKNISPAGIAKMEYLFSLEHLEKCHIDRELRRNTGAAETRDLESMDASHQQAVFTKSGFLLWKEEKKIRQSMSKSEKKFLKEEDRLQFPEAGKMQFFL